MKKVKVKLFKIESTRHRTGVRTYQVGTIENLIKYCSYTLECGASYQHEKGNKKINLNPKGIKSLITNLNNALDNSAANGYAGSSYQEVQITPEDIAKYTVENS